MEEWKEKGPEEEAEGETIIKGKGSGREEDKARAIRRSVRPVNGRLGIVLRLWTGARRAAVFPFR